MIEAKALSKRYGSKVAVNDLSQALGRRHEEPGESGRHPQAGER